MLCYLCSKTKSLLHEILFAKPLCIAIRAWLLLFLVSKHPKIQEVMRKISRQAMQMTVQSTVQKKNILFFGNSLTAAYGLDPTEGFAGLIEARIDSLGLPYKVINAGLEWRDERRWKRSNQLDHTTPAD